MEFVPIGKLKKAHGLKGEIKFEIDEKYWESVTDIDAIFIEQAGSKMPFFVEYIRGNASTITKLEEIDTKEATSIIANKIVYVRRTDIDLTDEEIAADDSGLEYAFLEGYTIVNTDKEIIGIIEEVADYPQQEMAIVSRANKEILVPLLAEWIITVQKETRQVIMEFPEGLIDL